MPIYFDQSLKTLAEVVERHLGSALPAGVALRDASGRLSFFVDDALEHGQLEALARELTEALGAYARPDRVVADRESAGASSVLNDPQIRSIPLGDTTVRYLDRAIVGADWQQGPGPDSGGPPRFVFASLKGGVGRSTALSVVAAEQARRGRNVLVVDLDLEAPGIGSMLLDPDRRPSFGSLDFLVESGLRGLSDNELEDFVGTSSLTSGAGLVDVVPVVGTASESNAVAFMSKLSRAMVEDVSPTGDVISLRTKTRRLVDRIAGRKSYDLVLVDARAGLAELAAGPLLALGARVLLFGTAQRQTLEGFRYLLAHLGSLTPLGETSPWGSLQVVHAKASGEEGVHSRFNEAVWELFSTYLYEEQDDLDGFNFDIDDPDAPHHSIPVLMDTRLVDWDPVSRPSELTQGQHLATFGRLIEYVDDAIGG